MTIAIWIVSGFLAVLYLFVGLLKVTLPQPKLVARFPYVETFGVVPARAVAALEILGAMGIILPRLTGILPLLSGFAAVGFALVQVGGIVLHVRHRDFRSLPMNVVLLLLAAFVAVGIFLGY